jgi:dienelactone hydrolase
MASAGYIVAMPDYAGFGQSNAIHPYVHHFLGNSVEGIVSHALSMPRANTKVYLTGYSEGGYATMAGARALYQPPGITPDIRAIVPCDGPYSLSGSMLTQMLTEKLVKVPSYLLYTTSGYYAAEPGRMPSDVTTLLEYPWYGYVGGNGLFNGDHTNAEVGALVPAATTTPGGMLTSSAYTDLKNKTGKVYDLLAENDAWQGWVPTSPLVFVHCREDDVVPITNAEVAQLYYKTNSGVTFPIAEVQAIPFIESVMGTTHVAAYPPAMLAAFTIIRRN